MADGIGDGSDLDDSRAHCVTDLASTIPIASDATAEGQVRTAASYQPLVVRFHKASLRADWS